MTVSLPAEFESFFWSVKSQIVSSTPKTIFGLIVFVLFLIIGRLIDWVFITVSKRLKRPAPVIMLIASLIHLLIIILGMIAMLSVMGVDVTGLIASLGLTGFALGFALRDALSNVMAGALILIYRPFRKGDQIIVTGLEGVVRNIDLRYTTLDTPEKRMLIPNSTLMTNPVIVFNPRQAAERNASQGS